MSSTTRWLASVIVVALAACRPPPRRGQICRVPDRLVCAGGDRALSCESGTWRDVACRGPRGCVHGERDDACDDSLAVSGDACPRNPPVDYACAVDRVEALVCRDGRFDTWRHCRGEHGCRVVGERHVDCDTTLGEPEDACDKAGTYACSVDRRVMLECDGRSFAVASSCRGPGACRFDADGPKVDCDDGVALEGDPCDEPHRIACEVGGKAELVCGEAHQYVRQRECRHVDCRIDGQSLDCD